MSNPGENQGTREAAKSFALRNEGAVNALKALFASLPFTGGIASLMSDYIPNRRMERIEQLAKEFGEDLNRLKDKVDESRIQTDSFARLFEESFKGAASNYHEEKLESFRAILINSLVSSDLTDDEKEYILSLVNDLTALHIRVLSFMYDADGYVQRHGLKPSNLDFGGFRVIFEKVFYPISIDVTRSAYSDLYRRGLVTTEDSIFATMTSSRGRQLIASPSRVSALGQRFVRFITVPR